MAYFLLLPSVLGLVGLRRRSMFTFLLVAASAALSAAIVTGEHYASPLGYDNADSLVVAVFLSGTIRFLAVGLLLPAVTAVLILWRREQS